MNSFDQVTQEIENACEIHTGYNQIYLALYLFKFRLLSRLIHMYFLKFMIIYR